MRWVKSVVLVLLILVVVVFGVGWALVQSPIFHSVRSEFIEKILSEQFGRKLVIQGDAHIEPGVNSTFVLTDVAMPGKGSEDKNLAELADFSLKTNTYDLLFGKPDFHALKFSGLTVNIWTTEDGHLNWSDNESSKETQPQSTDQETSQEVGATAADAVSKAFKVKRLINYIALRSEEFDDVNIQIINDSTGFNFDFEIETLVFEHPEENQRFLLSSKGTVNGVSYEFSGDYTFNGPFQTTASFGSLEMNFNGKEKTKDEGGGYTGKLELETSAINDLLDTLALTTKADGSLRFSADIDKTYETTSLQAISTEIDFSGGKQFTASGSIADLESFDGVDIELSSRFYPEGQQPARANRLAEVRLTEASARLLGKNRALTVEDAVFETNAFEQTIDHFGPIVIGSIQRSPEGKLELKNISIQAGPQEAPFIQAKGQINDALEGKQFDFTGQIQTPVNLLLADLNANVAAEFGILEGDISINDKTGEPQLSELRLQTAQTELWYLDATAASTEEEDQLGFEMDLKSGISDTGAFLAGLGLAEIDASPIDLTIQSHISVQSLKTKLGITVKESNLDTSLNLEVNDKGRFVTGLVESDEIRLSDLTLLAKMNRELQKMSLLSSNAKKDAAVKPSGDAIKVQPLVLPKEERTLESLLAVDGVEPLVLPEPMLSDIFTIEKMLNSTDVDVGFDLRRLSGVKGVSSISSELVAKDGKATFGPVNVSYGGGHLKAKAAVDLIDTPDRITVSGSTGGWDFGKILDSVGAGINAYGVLNGDFDLTGRNTSVSDFVKSMNGAVTARLSGGKIDSSLLELSGLGVLPWLFSNERREGHTEITCLVAPVRINRGRVTFDQFVAETGKVQVVAKGALDWRKDAINIRVEPRPVGDPLARSAWPVDVTGRLSDPNVKPQVGGSFSKRSDGADTMPAKRKPCFPDILQLQ